MHAHGLFRLGAVVSVCALGTVQAVTLPADFSLQPRGGAVGVGFGIGKLIAAVKDHLKDKNAYDPSVPNKCILKTYTRDGGNCQTTLDCNPLSRNQIEHPSPGGDPAEVLPKWNVCYLAGEQHFEHEELGRFSITMTEAGGKNGNNEDGLHHPVFRFEALNNWEPMNVQAIIDAGDKDTGNLCEKRHYDSTHELTWSCGIPRLTKSASSAFGINLMEGNSPKQGYQKGWCTTRVIQYQRNEFGTGANFEFAIQIFDAAGDQIGHVQKAAVNNQGRLSVGSALPWTLEVISGPKDEDPVQFCYAGDCWTCDDGATGQAHYCTLGHGAEHGYENGDRKGEFGFTC